MPSNPVRSPTTIEVQYGSKWGGDDDITMNSLLQFLEDSTGMIENIYTDDLKDFGSYLDFTRRNTRLSFRLKIWGFPDKYIIRVIFPFCPTVCSQDELNMREKFMSFAVFWWGNNKDAYLNPIYAGEGSYNEPFIRTGGGELNAD